MCTTPFLHKKTYTHARPPPNRSISQLLHLAEYLLDFGDAVYLMASCLEKSLTYKLKVILYKAYGRRRHQTKATTTTTT